MIRKVFLGGTCNESTWRNNMIHYLKEVGLEWFNPIVDDWNEEAQENELRERKECDFCLYTITPMMNGVYSIAEVIDDCHKRPDRTIFVLCPNDGDEYFNDSEWRSLTGVAKMVKRIGGKVFFRLIDAALWMASVEEK